jgi:hypothetical protein
MKVKNPKEMIVMQGINNGADVQKLLKTNPLLTLLNNYNNTNKKDGEKPQQQVWGNGEDTALTNEAAMLAPQQLDPTAEQKNDDQKTEDQRKIDEQRDKAMTGIDTKMMDILRQIKQDPQLKKITIENFDKAKEQYQARPSSDNYTNWSKPSMIVLELLSQESRLPSQYTGAFGDLLKEYQGIMSPQFDKEALNNNGNNVKSAWSNAIGLQGLKLTA